MKNILIYINPTDKKFDREHDELTKMQIDNSLALGWRPSDILLVTNFPYEYKKIKSTLVGDYAVFDQNRSTKVPAIIELFKKGLIENDELYWFHDHDAFQLVPFNIGLEKDAGFTDHGAKSKTWNAGSFFFKKSAEDIFGWIYEYMNHRGTNEQNALTYMWENHINGVNNRFEMVDIGYNVIIYCIDENVNNAKLPIKVAHFHPHKRRHLELFKSRGLLPEYLLEIFRSYGIQ